MKLFSHFSFLKPPTLCNYMSKHKFTIFSKSERKKEKAFILAAGKA